MVGGIVTDLELLQDDLVAITTANPLPDPGGQVLLLDLGSNQLTNVLEREATVHSVASTTGGRFVATAGDSVVVGDDQGLVREFSIGQPTWQIASAPSNRDLIAVSTWSNDVLLFDLSRTASAAPLLEFQMNGAVDTLRWSPDTQRLLVFDNNGYLALADLERVPARVLPMQSRLDPRGRAAAWAQDGKRFLVAGESGRGIVFAANNGQVLSTLSGHVGQILCCAALPDGGWLTSGKDGTIRSWSRYGAPRRIHRGHRATVAGGLGVSADGTTLLSGSADGTARLWDLSIAGSRELFCDIGGFYTSRFTTTSSTAHLVAGTSHGVLYHAALTGERTTIELPSQTIVSSIDFLPDGRAVVAQFGGRLHIVDLEEGRVEQTHESGRRQSITFAKTLRNGDILVLMLRDNQSPPALCRTDATLESLEKIADLPQANQASGLVTDPEEQVVYIGGHTGELFAIDITTGVSTQIAEPIAGGSVVVAVSPDGRWLAVGGVDRSIRLYRRERDPSATPSRCPRAAPILARQQGLGVDLGRSDRSSLVR